MNDPAPASVWFHQGVPSILFPSMIVADASAANHGHDVECANDSTRVVLRNKSTHYRSTSEQSCVSSQIGTCTWCAMRLFCVCF
jgi:hypothetical protein